MESTLHFEERTAMSDRLAEVEERARRLPTEERARLAEVLLDSLRETPLAEIEAAWEHEIEDRVRAFDRGESQTNSAADVFAEARRLTN
jgi:putative addiction module component (TIGR02574 family)